LKCLRKLLKKHERLDHKLKVKYLGRNLPEYYFIPYCENLSPARFWDTPISTFKPSPKHLKSSKESLRNTLQLAIRPPHFILRGLRPSERRNPFRRNYQARLIPPSSRPLFHFPPSTAAHISSAVDLPHFIINNG